MSLLQELERRLNSEIYVDEPTVDIIVKGLKTEIVEQLQRIDRKPADVPISITDQPCATLADLLVIMEDAMKPCIRDAVYKWQVNRLLNHLFREPEKTVAKAPDPQPPAEAPNDTLAPAAIVALVRREVRRAFRHLSSKPDAKHYTDN